MTNFVAIATLVEQKKILARLAEFNYEVWVISKTGDILETSDQYPKLVTSWKLQKLTRSLCLKKVIAQHRHDTSLLRARLGYSSRIVCTIPVASA
jgi:hypothetical protein